jgi:hypothetical protein
VSTRQLDGRQRSEDDVPMLRFICGLQALTLAVVAGATAGCGGASHSAATSPPATSSVDSAPATTATPTPSGSPASTTTFTPARSWAWRGSTQDGYRFDGYIEVGDATHPSDSPILPGFDSISDVEAACSINDQTDGLIPVSLRMKNVTPNFSADIDTTLRLDSLSLASLPIAYTSSSGVTCGSISTDQQYSAYWTSVAPQGETSPNYLYVVVPNLYNPNSPSGDPQLLRQLVITLGPSTRSSKQLLLHTMHGPGICVWDDNHSPVDDIPLHGDQVRCPGAASPGH